MIPAKSSVSDVIEDKSFVPPTPFKAPVPPPSVASKDPPGKSDKKLDELWLSLSWCYILVKF